MLKAKELFNSDSPLTMSVLVTYFKSPKTEYLTDGSITRIFTDDKTGFVAYNAIQSIELLIRARNSDCIQSVELCKEQLQSMLALINEVENEIVAPIPTEEVNK
jgi:hypothetical protein